MQNKKYIVFRTERNENKKTVIQKNLTEKQAQKLVQDDIKINPTSEKYMIVYTEQN